MKKPNKDTKEMFALLCEGGWKLKKYWFGGMWIYDPPLLKELAEKPEDKT